MSIRTGAESSGFLVRPGCYQTCVFEKLTWPFWEIASFLVKYRQELNLIGFFFLWRSNEKMWSTWFSNCFFTFGEMIADGVRKMESRTMPGFLVCDLVEKVQGMTSVLDVTSMKFLWDSEVERCDTWVDSRPRAPGRVRVGHRLGLNDLHLCPARTFFPHHHLQSTLIILTIYSIEE